MKLLDKYLLKNYILTFLFSVGILAVVSCVIDYSEKIDDILKNEASFQDTLVYFINFIPSIIALLYPLFIFISTIFFTSKLASRSEIIAIVSAGVPIRRILRPYIIGSVLIGCISSVFNHVLVPKSNRIIYNFEEEFIRTKVTETNKHVHMRIAKDQYIYLQNFKFTNNTGENFSEEIFQGNKLVQKIQAKQIQYVDSTKQWILKDILIRTNDDLKETLTRKDTLIRQYDLVPNDLDEDDQRKTTLSSWQLYQKTLGDHNRGLENISAYAYELHRRFADSFSGIILTVIAFSIASRKIRGGSGMHLALGIILSAIFLLFVQFSKTFAVNNALDPMIAAWIPNALFSIVAIYLYKKRSQ